MLTDNVLQLVHATTGTVCSTDSLIEMVQFKMYKTAQQPIANPPMTTVHKITLLLVVCKSILVIKRDHITTMAIQQVTRWSNTLTSYILRAYTILPCCFFFWCQHLALGIWNILMPTQCAIGHCADVIHRWPPHSWSVCSVQAKGGWHSPPITFCTLVKLLDASSLKKKPVVMMWKIIFHLKDGLLHNVYSVTVVWGVG